MRLSRTLAFGVVAGVSILTLGGVAPAMADTTPPPSVLSAETKDAVDYALDARGQDIFAAQSAASRAAWTPELGRVAAQQAGLYRAAVVYGNLDPVQVGEVIPMNKAVDASLHGKLTAGMTVSNGSSAWKGTGFKFPRFSASTWSSVRSVAGGPVGLTVGLIAFDQRAEIANGLLSWTGLDVAGTVCSDPVAGGHNPVNWITGVNCDQWRAANAFQPNVDYSVLGLGGECANGGVTNPSGIVNGTSVTALHPNCRSAAYFLLSDHNTTNGVLYIAGVTWTDSTHARIDYQTLGAQSQASGSPAA